MVGGRGEDDRGKLGEDDERNPFAAEMVAMRKQRGWTQEDLAAKMVVELPRVSRTGNLRLNHAASCPFRYSSRTSCGVL